MEDSMTTSHIERARSARSRCRFCRKKIALDELRLGQSETDPRNGRPLTRWYHLKCAAEAVPDALERALVACEAEVPERESLEKVIAGARRRPAADLWWRALEERDLDELRRLRSAGTPTDLRDAAGATALHRSVGDVPTLELLLSLGANVNARDGSGFTPLHHGASALCVASVERLLAAGALVDARGGRSEWNEDARSTALHVALNGMLHARRRVDGDTRTRVVEILLRAGANPALRNASGMSSLESSLGEPELFELLLRHAKAPPRPAVDGWTLLHTAAKRDAHRAIGRLIAFGSDPNAELTRERVWGESRTHGVPRVVESVVYTAPVGVRPLDVALSFASEQSVRALRDGGATANVSVLSKSRG